MTIPNSAIQLLVLLVLVVPGFVYQAVRIQLRGRTVSDNELSTRIMHAIVASTVFALAYAGALGSRVTEPHKLSDSLVSHPRVAAGLGFVAAFVLPALAALVVVWLRNNVRLAKVLEKVRPESWARIDPRPSAWDVAFGGALPPRFVRVRMKDGTWFAGWLGENSYASAWPDPRTLYVEASFQIDATGTIGLPVVGSAGAVIDCTDAVLIELLESADASGKASTSGTMESDQEDADG